MWCWPGSTASNASEWPLATTAATTVAYYEPHVSRAERRLRAELAAFARARAAADAYWYGAQARRLARDERPRIPAHPGVVARIPHARHAYRREPGRPSRSRCRRPEAAP